MLPACEPRPVLTRRGIAIKIYFVIIMDKYVAFIKRRKERKYKYRREERKREFNTTVLEVASVICGTLN
jgi:hypothetical protein